MSLLKKSQQRSQVAPTSLDPARPLITILGPTASGKSRLALDLASRHQGEIVCADSRTLYVGMDKGTAKPSAEERAQVPHHLLDICQPSERFSAQEFVWQARTVLDDIWSRGKSAFLVGGSGLYIDALLFGYQFRDPRYADDAELNDKSLEELVDVARKLYPKEINQIDVGNRRRVEQLILKGPAKDDDRKQLALPGPIFGLDQADDVLKTTIAQRTNLMLESGWAEEVSGLVDRFGAQAPGLATVGYRELLQNLDADYATQAEAINRATWQLVRKQRTWFRRNPYIEWLDESAITQRVDQMLGADSSTIVS